MPKRKDSDRVQIGLRLREDMRRKLETAAKTNGQSINAEIESRLENSFRREERIADLRKAIFAGLFERVGGEPQFRQLMALGDHFKYFACDIAAPIPDKDTTEFTANIVQIPTVEKTKTPGLGNFTSHHVRLTRLDAAKMDRLIREAVGKFHREKKHE